MSDLIDRQAAIDAVMELIEEGYEWRSGVSRKISLLNAVYCALEDIPSAQPTVDAVPVRHGKWKWLSCTYDRVPKEKEYECSECHHKTIVHGDDMPWEKYCPNCGADMRGEDSE